MECREVRKKDVTDVLSELRKDKERRFLDSRRVRGNGLEHKREELRPGVVREEDRSKLRNGVTQFLGYRLDLLPLHGGEEDGLEVGLGRGGEPPPDVPRGCKLLPEEDGAHGADLVVRRGVQEMSEPHDERLRVVVAAKIEQRLRLRPLLVP